MKCKQSCPRFELRSSCPFPTTVTIAPWAHSQFLCKWIKIKLWIKIKFHWRCVYTVLITIIHTHKFCSKKWECCIGLPTSSMDRKRMVVSILLISCQTECWMLVCIWIPYQINILLSSIWLSSNSLLLHIFYFLFVWVTGHFYHDTKKRERVIF